MSDSQFLGFAISGTIFAALFLGGLIVFGSDTVRAWALAASFVACVSQFIGQDRRAWLASRLAAYSAMGLGLVAFFVMVRGG